MKVRFLKPGRSSQSHIPVWCVTSGVLYFDLYDSDVRWFNVYGHVIGNVQLKGDGKIIGDD